MNWSRLKSAYYRLPVFLQNAACTAYGWKKKRIRHGDVFEDCLTFLRNSEWWSESDIEAYQSEKLQNIIQHAYRNVPYYRKVMKERRLTPSDIRTKADLRKLPVLSKEDIRANFDRLVATNVKRSNLRREHTSGTTGKSLDFYRTDAAIAFQWAIWWRYRERFGLSLGDPHANFTGKPVVAPGVTSPPYWRRNHALNQVIIPMQQITPEKTRTIVRMLNHERLAFYAGYPSIIAQLCANALEQGLSLEEGPKVVTTGAENMLAEQKTHIEAFTGARITDQYGFSEGCGNASECPSGVYHEDFEFGILECQPDDRLGAKQGKILCTGFACPEFPLIRYDVGDIGTWTEESYECRCGRHSAVITSIDGRIEDYVLTPEGRKIMRFDYIFKDTKHVKESQVIQKEKGGIIIKLVQRSSYSTDTEAEIRDMIHEWISPQLEVDFEYVPEIDREPNGKLRAVKSFLDRDANSNEQ